MARIMRVGEERSDFILDRGHGLDAVVVAPRRELVQPERSHDRVADQRDGRARGTASHRVGASQSSRVSALLDGGEDGVAECVFQTAAPTKCRARFLNAD